MGKTEWWEAAVHTEAHTDIYEDPEGWDGVRAGARDSRGRVCLEL